MVPHSQQLNYVCLFIKIRVHTVNFCLRSQFFCSDERWKNNSSTLVGKFYSFHLMFSKHLNIWRHTGSVCVYFMYIIYIFYPVAREVTASSKTQLVCYWSLTALLHYKVLEKLCLKKTDWLSQVIKMKTVTHCQWANYCDTQAGRSHILLMLTHGSEIRKDHLLAKIQLAEKDKTDSLSYRHKLMNV